MKIKKWCWEHSLSLTLGIGAVGCTVISRIVEYGTWACDFWLALATGFSTGALIFIVSGLTWEKNADPGEPPE